MKVLHRGVGVPVFPPELPYAREVWRADVAQMMKHAQPHFVICQDGDDNELVIDLVGVDGFFALALALAAESVGRPIAVDIIGECSFGIHGAIVANYKTYDGLVLLGDGHEEMIALGHASTAEVEEFAERNYLYWQYTDDDGGERRYALRRWPEVMFAMSWLSAQTAFPSIPARAFVASPKGLLVAVDVTELAHANVSPVMDGAQQWARGLARSMGRW